MKRVSLVGCVGALLYAVAPRGIAVAQNSTQAPPPSAAKIGGEGPGDPNGAIRALGTDGDDQTKGGAPPVTIPKLGGEGGPPTGGAPPGTSGPPR